MQVVVTAPVLYHDKLGRLLRGRIVDVSDAWARRWLTRGFVQRYAAAEADAHPFTAAGTPSSALPAAPVSQKQTSSSSAPGGRTRKPRTPEA